MTLYYFEAINKILHSRKGFTLLELMVSIAMVGIISLIITSAVRLGIHTVDTGEKRINSLERTRASMSIIDSQIQSHIPLTFEENGEKKHYFRGERQSIQFSTNYSIWGGQTGYVIVKYKSEPDNNGKLMLAASENIIGIDSTRETKLFEGLDSVYFEYFFKDPTEEYGEWVDSWTDILKFPEKVKMHIMSGKRNFSMIIPVRATGTAIPVSPIPGTTPGSAGKFIGP